MGSFYKDMTVPPHPSSGPTPRIYQQAQPDDPPVATGGAEHHLSRLQTWKSYPETLAEDCEKNQEILIVIDTLKYTKPVFSQIFELYVFSFHL